MVTYWITHLLFDYITVLFKAGTLLEMYESIMVNEQVASTINLICCHGLSDHHQFHGFLSEIEYEYAYCPITQFDGLAEINFY